MTDAEFRTVLARWYDVRSYARLRNHADRTPWIQNQYDYFIVVKGFTFAEAIEDARETIAHLIRNYPLRPCATEWNEYLPIPPTTPARLN